MVRPGPAMMAPAFLMLAGIALGADAPPTPKPPRPPLERRPYAIRAWVSATPSARLDAGARDRLVSGWTGLARRYVGAPWAIEVDPGEGPLGAVDPESVDAEAVRAAAGPATDKVWLIRIDGRGNGYSLSAREYDAATRLIGPLCVRAAPSPADAPRALLRLTLDAFAPVAEVASTSAGGATLRVQAAALPASDALGRVAAPNAIFRPLRVSFDAKDQVRSIVPIRATYLRVGSVDAGIARCEIETRLSDPLSKMVVGRSRVYALGVRPSGLPTRLRFLVGKDREPAAGYTLTARRIPDGAVREVGTTDREGRVTLPAGFADGLVTLRLIAGGVEPLYQIPIMPGEQVEERLIVLPDVKVEAVALESTLAALRDQIVDQVAYRGRIEARLKARADASAWDEVKPLIEQYRALPTRDSFQSKLDALRLDAERRQKADRVLILTPSASGQLAEVSALADRYLDDDVVRAYDDAYKQAKSDAPKPKPKAAAKAPAPPTPPVPAPAPAPAPKSIPRGGTPF